MITQICLAIIAVALVVLVSFLTAIFFKLRKAVQLMQADLHTLSVETTSLVIQLNELAADMKRKSQSLNFLFKPLSLFNKEDDPFPGKPSVRSDLISQMAQWITASLILVKKTKELVNE